MSRTVPVGDLCQRIFIHQLEIDYLKQRFGFDTGRHRTAYVGYAPPSCLCGTLL